MATLEDEEVCIDDGSEENDSEIDFDLNPEEESGTTTFLRSFVHEEDSRHEFTSTVDAAVYNEREKCFDLFSNLLRQYQTLPTNGSKIASEGDFWSIIACEGAKVLDLMPCNFDWFADLFVEMLLHYCLKDSLVRHIPPNESSSLSRPAKLLSHELSDVKQRKLEERLNPHVNSNQRYAPPSNTNPSQFSRENKVPRRKMTTKDPYELPSATFTGTAQFFFRFILHTSHSFFSVALECALLDKIQILSASLASEGRSRDFCASILSLKTLGKFYGLVLFSPHWTLPLVEDSVMAAQLTKHLYRKQRSLAPKVNYLVTVLQDALRNGCLSVAISWIASSLTTLNCFLRWREIPVLQSIFDLLHRIELTSSSSSSEVFSARRSVRKNRWAPSNILPVISEIIACLF